MWDTLYVISFEVYDGFSRFHRSKDFEARKAGKSAIWPWLSCPYNKHRLMDLPSSVLFPIKIIGSTFTSGFVSRIGDMGEKVI